MPPKAKFTKEQIVDAAMAIVKEEGADALTARALGKKLGSSSCPIFTVFASMDAVKAEVVHAAKALYADYIRAGLAEVPAFKGAGMQYIRFAQREPHLFALLFMSETGIHEPRRYLPAVDDNYEEILASLRDSYQMDTESAERLYIHMGIYTHGIGALYARHGCSFDEEEVSRMLTEVFVSLLKECKRTKGGEQSGLAMGEKQKGEVHHD